VSLDRDRLLNEAGDELMAAIDRETYARTMQVARIRLGSASWREHIRWWLGLGPAIWMYEAADFQIAMEQ
jgi:hypothetical protein